MRQRMRSEENQKSRLLLMLGSISKFRWLNRTCQRLNLNYLHLVIGCGNKELKVMCSLTLYVAFMFLTFVTMDISLFCPNVCCSVPLTTCSRYFYRHLSRSRASNLLYVLSLGVSQCIGKIPRWKEIQSLISRWELVLWFLKARKVMACMFSTGREKPKCSSCAPLPLSLKAKVLCYIETYLNCFAVGKLFAFQ